MAALKGEAWWLELTAIKRESTWDLWQVLPEPKGNVFGFAFLGHSRITAERSAIKISAAAQHHFEGNHGELGS